jgi:hypothetical protein
LIKICKSQSIRLKEPDLSNSLFIFVAHLRLHCFPNYLIKYIPFVISFLTFRRTACVYFPFTHLTVLPNWYKSIKCGTTIDKVP